MRISTPIIESIESGKYPSVWDDFENPQVAEQIQRLKEYWPRIAEKLRGNVFYCARSYSEAILKSKKAFLDMYNKKEDGEAFMSDMCKDLPRCFIETTPAHVQKECGYSHTYTMSILDDEFWFQGQFIDVFPTMIHLSIGSQVICAINFSLSYNDEEKVETNSNIKTYFDIYVFMCMEKFAKVESRIVAPKCRVRPDLRYMDMLENDSRLKVQVRDCRWFTTIIRNEGFEVRGHFRLQPKKENGEWTRELIYINPYQKKGYHRTASIEQK